MPIRIDRSTVDNDFWDAERRQEAEWFGPEVAAQMEASRAAAQAAADAARDSAAREAPPPPPAPPPESMEPLSSPFPPTQQGVRDRFVARVAQTRAETGRPLREMRGELTGSDAELVSYLRVSSEAMRVSLLATVSEPWTEGSDEEVMAKVLRDAIVHAGSRVPSVELPQTMFRLRRRCQRHRRLVLLLVLRAVLQRGLAVRGATAAAQWRRELRPDAFRKRAR